MKIKLYLLSFFVGLFSFLTLSAPAQAVKYDLIAPTEQLQSGGDAQFTITIDTEGASLSSTQIGISYQADLIEFQTAVPGTTFTNISVTPDSTGKIVIGGSSATPFSGSGDFAYLTFKIIATSPGSAELCALYAPSTTPAPTQSLPTALPKTGYIANSITSIFVGSIFFALAVGMVIFNSRNKHIKHPHHTKKPS